MTRPETFPPTEGSLLLESFRQPSAENGAAVVTAVAPRREPRRHRRRKTQPATNVPAATRRGQRGGIVLIMALTLITGIAMTGFLFKSYTLQQYKMKMADYERGLNHLKAAIGADSARQHQIQRVMAIIEQYNPAMASERRYEIANEIYQMSIKYANLNVNLICATITHESALTWRPDIRSHMGAMGLMQIMPGTGVFLADDAGIPWTSPEAMLYDPIVNIRLGCRYLSTLISLYELDGGLAAYNGGEKSAARWLAGGRDDNLLAEETRGYVPAVLRLYREIGNY